MGFFFVTTEGERRGDEQLYRFNFEAPEHSSIYSLQAELDDTGRSVGFRLKAPRKGGSGRRRIIVERIPTTISKSHIRMIQACTDTFEEKYPADPDRRVA